MSSYGDCKTNCVMCRNVGHAHCTVIAYFVDVLSVLGNTRSTFEYVPAIHNGWAEGKVEKLRPDIASSEYISVLPFRVLHALLSC